MEQLLKEIGINEKGTYSPDGSYVVDIKDYNAYGKYFSLLENSSIVEEAPDTTQITIHTTNITYVSDTHQIILQADFDEDLYKLIVKKL